MQSILKLFGILHTKSTNSTEIHFQRTNGVRLPLHLWHSEIFYPIFNLLAYDFRSYLTINYHFIAHLVDAFDQNFVDLVVDFLCDGVEIKCLTFSSLLSLFICFALDIFRSTFLCFILVYPPLPYVYDDDELFFSLFSFQLSYVYGWLLCNNRDDFHFLLLLFLRHTISADIYFFFWFCYHLHTPFCV